MTYDEIMTALLQAYEAHPEMDVEQIIVQVAQELGLGEKSMESIKKSMGMLDKMQEKKESLETAHENCNSTKKWILSETAKITEGRTDDEIATITKAITKAVDQSVEDSLNSDEPNSQEN